MLAAMADTLTDLLRSRTRTLHVQAERSGIIADLVRGRANRHGYALWLRNILPAYEALERSLDAQRERAGMRAVADRAVYRAPTIEADLRALEAADWTKLPLLDSGARYAERITTAATRDGGRLLGHAYTRFLGDLNGGRILSRLLGSSLGLGAEALSFYAYPEIDDLDAFKSAYRLAIDEAGESADTEAVADEALASFQLNIDVAVEVQQKA
jgi:heme oxygenase